MMNFESKANNGTGLTIADEWKGEGSTIVYCF